MAADALEIVDEYLEQKDARIRMNAATALAALESQEGTERLMRVAIEDDQIDVRAHALDELRSARVRPTAAAYLSASLRSDTYAGRTSWILGDLRASKPDDPVRGLVPFLVRQQADLRTADADVVATRWRPSRGRLLLAGAVGGAAAGFLLYLVLQAMAAPLPLTDDVWVALLIGALLVGPPLAWAVARKAQPLWNRHDRIAAVLSETWWCLVAIAMAGLPWAALFALGQNASPAASKLSSWRVLAAFVLQSAVCVLAARLAALVCQGLGGRWVQRLLGGLMAGLAAMIAVTVATQALAFGMARVDTGPVKEIWLLLLPVGFSVGLACCLVESAHRSGRSSTRRRRTLAIATLVLTVAVVGLYAGTALTRGRRAATDYVARVVADREPSSRDLQIEHVPSTIHLDATVSQSVQVEAPPGANPDFVVQLYAVTSSGPRLVKDWDDPPEMLESLEKGTYEVVVTTYPVAKRMSAALDVAAAYAMVLDREFWQRRAAPESLGAKRSVHVATGLPPGFNPYEVPVDSVNTRAGLVQVGMQVRLARPSDAAEGPTWIDAMDAASPHWMTVIGLLDRKRAGFVEVKVRENDWNWDSRWIVEARTVQVTRSPAR